MFYLANDVYKSTGTFLAGTPVKVLRKYHRDNTLLIDIEGIWVVVGISEVTDKEKV